MSNVFVSDARVKMPVLHETKDGCNMRRGGINSRYLSQYLDGLWYIVYIKIWGLRKRYHENVNYKSQNRNRKPF